MKEIKRQHNPDNIYSNREGGLFPIGHRPLTPEDHPTKKNIARADAIFKQVLKDQTGKVSTRAAFGIGGSAALVVAGATGGTLLATDAFNPPSERDINSFENSFNNSGPQIVHDKQLEKSNIDEVFDNEATSGVPIPVIIKRIPQEEIAKLDTFAKLRDDNNSTIVTLAQPKPPSDLAHLKLPDIQVEVGEDKNTLQFLYPLDLRFSTNPNAGIEYKKSYSGVHGTDRQAFQGKGYYDTFEFTGKGGSSIPEGAIVIMPVASVNGGYLKMSMGDGLIDVQASNGYTYRLLIVGVKGDDKVVPFQPIVPASEWTPEFNKRSLGSVSFFAIGGQPLLKTTEKLDKILVRVMGGIKPGTEPILLTDVKFFVSSDGKHLASE